MKKTVLTFGLIAGAILSVFMVSTIPFQDRIGFDHGEVIGYSGMVAAFLLVFFGVRSYRDNVAGGRISFGRAFVVGALITVVASLCYVATWEVIYSRIGPEFMAKYQAHVLEKARASGQSEAEIAQKKAELAKYAAMYENPVINAAVTFLEPLPVALVMSLVTAGVLSRRPKRDETEGAMAGVGVST